MLDLCNLKESYFGFILISMTSYWVTECIPVAIVSIMPVFLYPVFGILSSSRTAQLYFQDIIMLFFAGIISKTC